MFAVLSLAAAVLVGGAATAALGALLLPGMLLLPVAALGGVAAVAFVLRTRPWRGAALSTPAFGTRGIDAVMIVGFLALGYGLPLYLSDSIDMPPGIGFFGLPMFALICGASATCGWICFRFIRTAAPGWPQPVGTPWTRFFSLIAMAVLCGINLASISWLGMPVPGRATALQFLFAPPADVFLNGLPLCVLLWQPGMGWRRFTRKAAGLVTAIVGGWSVAYWLFPNPPWPEEATDKVTIMAISLAAGFVAMLALTRLLLGPRPFRPPPAGIAEPGARSSARRR